MKKSETVKKDGVVTVSAVADNAVCLGNNCQSGYSLMTGVGFAGSESVIKARMTENIRVIVGGEDEDAGGNEHKRREQIRWEERKRMDVDLC